MDPEDNTSPASTAGGQEDSEANLYELAYILEPQIAEENLPVETSKIVSAIEGRGGSVTLAENPHLRGLAYTIERSSGGKRSKYHQGHFGWIKFTMVPGEVPALATDLDHVNTIIRKLIIHSTKVNPPSFITRRTMRRSSPEITEHKATEAEIDKEVESLIASTGVTI